METVRLKYTAGRTMVKIPYNRKPFIFKKETGYIAEVPLGLANLLLPTGQFTAVSEKPKEIPKPVDKTLCEICGFKAKSEYGILVHKRKHKKEEK